MMTAAEAFSGLVPIVGAGGITSVLVAYLGYKAQAAKGRPEPLVPPATVSQVPFGAKDVELLAHAVAQLNMTALRIAMILEYHHIETTEQQDAFSEWSDRRELSALLAAQRARSER